MKIFVVVLPFDESFKIPDSRALNAQDVTDS
ncbi:MAG: hypothetical protein ACJAVK_003488 [Akkermansiaceae bacterium]|jgi:hypothetical protein